MNFTVPVNFIYQRGDLDSLEKALRTMAASPNVIVKINGIGGLANYSLLRGKVAETIRYGNEATRLSLTLGGQPSNMIADSLQFSFLDLNWLNDTARAVRRMDQVLAKSDIEKLPWDQRPYAGIAIFYANAGRLDRARFFMARDSASIPNDAERRIREPNRHAIRGFIARAEGRYDEAIRSLWRADTTYDGPNGNCAVCLYDDIGWTYAMAGQADSAIHYLELFRSSPYMGKQNFEASQRATNHRRLGELYEQKGDIAKAAENYRAFIEIWKNADASLQPQVAEVRRRLSRLADVEGRR